MKKHGKEQIHKALKERERTLCRHRSVCCVCMTVLPIRTGQDQQLEEEEEEEEEKKHHN